MPWGLLDFHENLERWTEIEHPGSELRDRVVAWIWNRRANPYAGVKRQSDFPNLWFGPIPGTADEKGEVVTCSYEIEERSRMIRCKGIATLRPPF